MQNLSITLSIPGRVAHLPFEGQPHDVIPLLNRCGIDYNQPIGTRINAAREKAIEDFPNSSNTTKQFDKWLQIMGITEQEEDLTLMFFAYHQIAERISIPINNITAIQNTLISIGDNIFKPLDNNNALQNIANQVLNELNRNLTNMPDIDIKTFITVSIRDQFLKAYEMQRVKNNRLH